MVLHKQVNVLCGVNKMEFQPDAQGRLFIPDAYEGEIEKRFKHLPRESELKKKKETKPKEEVKKTSKKK